MKPFVRKVLAAKVALVMAVSSIPGLITPAHAGIPVIDGANLGQNIMGVIESVGHTAKQIQQYQTQLQQYENMLKNTMQPSQQIWDQAQTTMNQLRGSIDTLSYYKQNLGSIDAYLGKFKDTAGYRSNPCFSVSGCTPGQWSAMKEQERLGSEAQKKSTDALFRGLEKQQDAMEGDATQLQRLQSAARGAQGQVEALGYANQLASNQANQLLQIRALLIAQQNAIATRNQVLADREAKESAASDQIRAGTFRPSSGRTW
ncbi:P-type conjugative transfer protein TrbJ [Massilia glaciei]|uniref:P-type conjugative transfer protein TrbJ n=1 Tax=Massilia glaciei TaxID=1524097 RepID=A0A2U2I6K0_9BURK|nr:P-type conjugative transfer protein TrbJ [Massilia glaciei]PWF55362.1 P-type conjugative transfer protein TrbJ [Massilia glaciei]